jgi:trehalose-6-phosphate synthase
MSMRSNLRFILPLITSVALVSVLFAAYQVRTERRNLRNDLQRRAEILGESLQETIEPVLANPQSPALSRIVGRFGHREHLEGIAIYDMTGMPLAITPNLPPEFRFSPGTAEHAKEQDRGVGEFVTLGEMPVYIYAMPLHRGADVAAMLVLFHDTAYIDQSIGHVWRDGLLNAAGQTFLIAILTFVLIHWTFTAPLTRTARWLRTLRTGQAAAAPPVLPEGEMFEQLTHEATHLARNLDEARAAAETEAHLRETAESTWTAERLRVSVRGKLQGSPLFVLSNREPYSHVHGEKGRQAQVPASGLVTALEPVLLACDGTWVAHGSGDADRETVDEHDRLRVPPDDPRYTLRRVWLSKDEEQGYYYGFANEGLWPLCHIAHTRPTFRSADWVYYQEVNQRFADAVLEEMAGSESPIVLIQDYHYALVPRLIKKKRPDARVSIFWHIPWPNPEAFRICPWQKELLEGLLGADLIGFHIQAHCNNFLETVDQALEARIEWDRFAVNRQGHLTHVRAFPISVAFPENHLGNGRHALAQDERAALMKALNAEATLLGIGVDRVDYTKGILERFRGIERFLETNPEYQREFTFIQIGAPSRSQIPSYQVLLAEVATEAKRINERFQAGRWKPIIYLDKHHSHDEIERYYRAADLCMVTSLHDGMNLVAKEFIAACRDESGVLILSVFTGASRELGDALQVNPYDIQQLADAICVALKMAREERKARMRRMRRIVREYNVYRWAGKLVSDLCELRVESNHAQVA